MARKMLLFTRVALQCFPVLLQKQTIYQFGTLVVRCTPYEVYLEDISTQTEH